MWTSSTCSSRSPVDRVLGTVASLVLCAAIGGCSESGPELGEVTGKVTLDGKAVQSAVLEFLPTGAGGSVSYAETNEAGEYEMRFTQSRDGACLGQNRVRITSGEPVIVGGERKGGEVFPPKYNSQTELQVEVKQGSNRFDFDCVSAGAVPPATGSGETGSGEE